MSFTLTARSDGGVDNNPRFEVTEEFPIQEPVWVLVFNEQGQAVSMFNNPRQYEWALSALRQVEEVLMRQAGYFDNLGLGPSDD
ncbi:hypothetical protein SEA_JFLIX2_63 [Rhodococcus phage Jflix2]|nr:hypothetical protein SEA_JFLIX2_63 [Rhodococcus phage Jflix2]